MDPNLHIIVTGEQGKARTFVVSKAFLKRFLVFLTLFLLVSTVASIKYFLDNRELRREVGSLATDVHSLTVENDSLSGVYDELSRRSQVVDKILSTLDIAPSSQDGQVNIGGPTSSGTSKNSGGPFSAISDESYEELISKVDNEIALLRPLPLGYPVQTDRISSRFGRRRDPINGRRAFHGGVDLSVDVGTEVRATADGRVIASGFDGAYGWYVKVDHGNGFATVYGHNKKVLVRKGVQVVRGEVLSLSGNTGRSTGPHLHYEIRRANKPINPLQFMNIKKLISIDGV